MLIKRIFDILLSCILLFFLLPVFLFIILILKNTGEGKVFFIQPRIGKGGKTVGVFKFVTMRENSESSGTITTHGDTRVLPFGKFLRKTKINELPQLMNVLLGSMSFVGPRPLVPETFNLYDEYIKDAISSVTPGVTGVGSTIFRNEEGLMKGLSNYQASEFYKHTIIPYKGELENWYVKHRTFLLDMRIIILTIQMTLFPNSKRTILSLGIPAAPDQLKAMLVKTK